MKTEDQKTTVISISLSPALAEQIRLHAKDNDQSISQLVRAAVKVHLENR